MSDTLTPIKQALEALKPFADAAGSEIWLDARFTKDKCKAARTAYEALSKYRDGWVLVPQNLLGKLAALKIPYHAHDDGLLVLSNTSGGIIDVSNKLVVGDLRELKRLYHAASARQHMEGE